MIMRIKTIMWNSESFPVLSQFNSSIFFVPPHPIRGGNSVRHSFENWWLIAAFYDCFFFVAQWRKQADSQFREGEGQNSLDFFACGEMDTFSRLSRLSPGLGGPIFSLRKNEVMIHTCWRAFPVWNELNFLQVFSQLNFPRSYIAFFRRLRKSRWIGWIDRSHPTFWR